MTQITIEYDKVDDGDSSDNNSHNKKDSLWHLRQMDQRTYQILRPKLWLNMMGLLIVVVVIVIATKSVLSTFINIASKCSGRSFCHSSQYSELAHQQTYHLAWPRL